MVSERRNELIADIFHRIHLVEKWGRGIKLMISKEPGVNFKEVGRHFVTVFKRKTLTPPTTPPITPPKYKMGLTELEKKVLSEIIRKPAISFSKIAANLGIGRDTVKEYVGKLKKKGVLKRTGTIKKGYWETLG